ncbi:MAG: hypothetical protein NXI12_01165 [Alphaproteobacteria bacterium]|nr:hypothetical protein [Alphaproteobacteria bacterium]
MHELNRADWRFSQHINVYEPADIKEEIKEKIFKYLYYMGLEYGVFDFIMDRGGDIVFLECNSDGQWLGYAHKAGCEDDFVGLFASMVRSMHI